MHPIPLTRSPRAARMLAQARATVTISATTQAVDHPPRLRALAWAALKTAQGSRVIQTRTMQARPLPQDVLRATPLALRGVAA